MPPPPRPAEELLLLNAALTLDAAAGTFAMRVYDGGLLRVQNFDFPVVVDLQGMQQAPQVKALLFHDPSRPAGHMTDVAITQGITTAGTLSVPEAQAYLKAAQDRGFTWEASIGATIFARASQTRPHRPSESLVPRPGQPPQTLPQDETERRSPIMPRHCVSCSNSAPSVGESPPSGRAGLRQSSASRE